MLLVRPVLLERLRDRRACAARHSYGRERRTRNSRRIGEGNRASAAHIECIGSPGKFNGLFPRLLGPTGGYAA